MATNTSTFTDPSLLIGGTAPASDSIPVVVYVKNRWDTTWTQADDIFPLELTWRSANSAFGRGEFLYRYGLKWDTSLPTPAWAEIPPVDYSRWFIKVEFDGHVWVGQIQAQVVQPLGGDQPARTGSMNFEALTLESVFHHTFITKSRVANYEQGAPPPEFITVDRGITFNDRGRQNQASEVFPTTLRYFARREDSKYWSTREIIHYAIQQWVPLNQSETQAGVTVEIDTADADRLPDWDRPIVATHGYRPIEVINRLVSRRRLLMWWFDLDEQTPSNPILKFRVASLTDQIVTDDDSNSLTANDRLFHLNVDQDASAQVKIEEDAASYVDQVIVQGAKRRNCFTMSFTSHPDFHVGIKKWSDALEVEYEEGGSSETNYPAAAKRGERRSFHARTRAKPKYRDVFARFGLDLSLDLPHRDPDSYVMAPFEVKMLPTLPLLEGRDYSGDAIINGEVFDVGLEEPEMPILVFLKIERPEYGSTAVYVDASKVGRSDDVPEQFFEDGYKFSCNLQVLPDDPSFRLEVVGDEQHILSSKPIMVPAGTPGVFEQRPEDKNLGNIDWRDMIATVCIEDDRYCSAQYPLSTSGNLPLRVLRIDAGPEYKLDYIAEDTAFDVDINTGLLQFTNGGYFRDDRSKLQSIARRAAEYYSQVRGILHLELDYQNPTTTPNPQETPIKLGSFILTIRNGQVVVVEPPSSTPYLRNINSVVTQITISFPLSESDTPVERIGRPRMKIVTSFGELQPEYFVARRSVNP